MKTIIKLDIYCNEVEAAAEGKASPFLQETKQPADDPQFDNAVRALFTANCSPADVRAMLDSYLNFTTGPNSSNNGSSSSNTAALARWYEEQVEDVQQMVHSRWGVLAPISLVVSSS